MQGINGQNTSGNGWYQLFAFPAGVSAATGYIFNTGTVSVSFAINGNRTNPATCPAGGSVQIFEAFNYLEFQRQGSSDASGVGAIAFNV